ITEHREQLRLRQEMNVLLKEEVDNKTAELRAAVAELGRRQKSVDRELALAHEIQKRLLSADDREFRGLRTAAFCRYMTKVGGDYYDIFRFADNRLGILMADVSGHGAPAALVTAMAKVSF